MNDLTVIYYTGNHENEHFENKIRKALLMTIGDLPLVSVSHKPINFGKSICVGDIPVTGHNAWRQLQIGVNEAKTRFICTAESDFLYPREYFEFKPEREDIFYVATPVYILWANRDYPHKFGIFNKKPGGSDGAIMVGREAIAKRLTEMYYGLKLWEQPDVNVHLFGRRKPNNSEVMNLRVPVITFKTANAMDIRSRHENENISEIPYWGNGKRLAGKFV